MLGHRRVKDQGSQLKSYENNIFGKIMKIEHFLFYSINWVVFPIKINAFENMNLCTCFRCNNQTFLNFLRKNCEKNSINRQGILCWTTLLIEICVKNYFLQSKMQNKFKFLNFCILKRKPCMNLNLFCILIGENNFLHKLELANLFSIKFSVDSCYFFTIFPQKIQTSLCITTKSL